MESRAPDVSVLVVTYNSRGLALQSVRSALRHERAEVVVWDNASHDGTAELLERESGAMRVFRSPENLGFAAGVNRAAERASGRHFLLLNPDAELEDGALSWLLATLENQPTAAAVGPALVYADGQRQESAFRFPGLVQLYLDLFPIPRLMSTRLNGRYAPADEAHPVDVVLGACVLVRGDAWRDVGPLDEGYFMYVEEVDWCRRARERGWQIWHEPRARAVHHGGQSTRQAADQMFVQLWRSRLRYYDKHTSPIYARLVRLLVRAGMRAEASRLQRPMSDPAREGRLAAVREVEALAA